MIGVHAVLILIGIVGVSFCQTVLSEMPWAVDTDQTRSLNLDGITFFHETHHNTDSSNNNSDPQTFRDEIKTMNTFSHFMPDQRKLSRTAGLSRAANKYPTEVKDKTGTLPTLYLSTGSTAKLNSLLNFAPTDEDKAPYTSEIVGFDSENNQVLKSSTGSGNEWNLGTLSTKDVTANDSVQQIEFSQLGIMDGGMTNKNEEINYFNANTNDLTARNVLFNTGNRFSTDSSGSSNNFDNTETVKNTLNQNNFIFGNTLTANDRSNLDDSSKFANNLFPTVKTTTTATPSSFAENTLIKENGIVKPFPFGQLQGNPLKINKRVPTFKTKNNFVDHSRTPVLKVKSAFVDLSGRQNPNMKPLGTFVDMSDKLSSEIESTVKTTAKPTAAPSTTPDKTTTIQTSKPSPITKRTEPIIPGPVLTGLALPGVMSANPSPTGNNANSAESSKANDLSPGRNGIISKSNVETGNSGTTISSGDKLNVDMLYPPAPFPVVDQSKLITNGGQAESNQPNVNKDGVNDTANGPSNPVAVSENDRTNNLDSSAVNVNVDGNSTGTFNYDYDMYADVATDISGELANNGQQGMDSRNTKLNARIEDMPKIPLVHKDTGDKDHFITDPNVQIINPNNNMVPNNVQTIPKNQNIPTSQTGIQNIGQTNNFQGVTDQRLFGNQNSAGNNFVNQNQFKNGQVIQNSFPQNTVRQNNQLSSVNAIADQNRMAQNGFSSNSINRLQQNMNSFSNDRNIPNTNVIQNDRMNSNINQNLPSGQGSMDSNIRGFASPDMVNTRNEIQRNSGLQTQNSQLPNVKPVQSNLNTALLGNQFPTFPSNNQNNLVNWQTSVGNSLSNQMTPSQIQNDPTSMQGNPNQIQNPINNAANTFAGNSNNQLNQISRQPVVGGSVPNMNMVNQVNNRVGINQGNPRNFGSKSNVNSLSNNFQNRPIVSNGIRNGQPSSINNIPRNINNIPITNNALSNNFNAGENIATNFQMRNNLAGPQFSNQLNAIDLRNNIQRLGQNNAAQSVLQNGRNVFGNGQQISFGNIPNNARNVMNNMGTFPGNIPQNQNNLQSNFLNGDFRNGLSNGFRPNTVLNPINMPGVNRFPGNVPFNTNQLQRNALNSPFGPFR